MRRTSAFRAGAVGAAVGGLLAAATLPGAATAAPDLAASSWYLGAMHVEQAQQTSTGADVTVAVLSGGVREIPELSGRVLTDGAPNGGGEANGGGRPDDTGPGTGVAALIAGAGDGTDRLLGVAPRATILPVDTGTDEPLPPASIVRLVHDAVDRGARVIDLSFVGSDAADPSDPDWAKKLVAYAGRHRAVLVTGTGDDPTGSIGRPADLPGVVAVSGLARDGSSWAGSATGPATAVAGPAEKITVPTGVPGEYRTVSGTSSAAALVSGVLALIFAKYPDSSAADAINRLIVTAHDRGEQGRDPAYGYGAVDAAAALAPDVPKAAGNPLVAPAGTKRPAGAADDDRSGLSTAVLVAVIVVAALLVLVLIVVIVTLRSRRRGGGGSNGGGGGGGGGPDGPTSPPGGGPVGYGQPPPQQQWQQPEREPVGAGHRGSPPGG